MTESIREFLAAKGFGLSFNRTHRETYTWSHGAGARLTTVTVWILTTARGVEVVKVSTGPRGTYALPGQLTAAKREVTRKCNLALGRVTAPKPRPKGPPRAGRGR